MMQLQSIITVYIENRNFHSKEARGKPMNYTYILQCADGTFYCGWTNCLNCRRNKGSCYKCIHHNIVAQTAAHDKKVENFMGSEIFMPGVKQGQLQSIDHAA